MTNFAQLFPAGDMTGTDPLRLAVAAYLARFTGLSRTHALSDLRIFMTWCAERNVEPFAAGRAQLELYVRWMQEVRRYKPSTVSRRMCGDRELSVSGWMAPRRITHRVQAFVPSSSS